MNRSLVMAFLFLAGLTMGFVLALLTVARGPKGTSNNSQKVTRTSETALTVA